ncbi:MAG: MFS transporter [Alphaproteobacteria bacterium]|nr:MFS transporter [Alphaproteobacteria bacterium]
MNLSAPSSALLRRAVDVRDGEIAALFLSFFYFFALLAAYYVLRPIRDEMGVQAGVENLQWLFTGTFIAMLAAVPVFGAVVKRFPRRRFVPWVYHFFTLNLLVFFAVLALVDDVAVRAWTARFFFIWVSVFNLFVVSVFWSFMADLFDNAQGRRLFGFIAAGGSAGALLGPSLTAGLAVPLGPTNLLLISAVLLQAAVLCIAGLLRVLPQPRGATSSGRSAPLGGSIWAGVTEIAGSRYLQGICLYIVFYTTTSTFLYFQQANIVADAFDDPGRRTQVFAVIDLLVAVLTLAIQLTATGRLMKRFGVGWLLAFLPVLSMIGLAVLAVAPTLTAIVVIQGLRRAGNFAVSRPAREVLFTVVSPELKYKAKNAIDTLVYRGGDALSGWLFKALSSNLGLSLSWIAAVTVPLAALWLVVSHRLGREQDRRAEIVDLPASA